MIQTLKSFLKANNKFNLSVDASATISDSVQIDVSECCKNFNLHIGKGAILKNIIIRISGEDNSLFIGEYCNIRGSIHIRHHGSKIFIDDYSTMVGVNLFSLEGKSINIGKDCMFSSGIYIRNSDEHSILDANTNCRINPAEDIFIGDHVWCGEGVTINKGVILPNNIIIGANAVITKKSYESNCIYAGVPAHKIKDNVNWNRKLI